MLAGVSKICKPGLSIDKERSYESKTRLEIAHKGSVTSKITPQQAIMQGLTK